MTDGGYDVLYRFAQETAARADALPYWKKPGAICECGGVSDARPSGDRVCKACGRVWTVGEIKREVPRP